MAEKKLLTTADGHPIADQENSLTAGPRGPLLMQDVNLIEQMQRFNRERVPERVVHAKGTGAFGKFTVTNDITKYTRAAIFSEVGKETEVAVRFSTVAGRARRRRRRARPARLRHEVLYRRGQLGFGGQQHTHLLCARPLQVPDVSSTRKSATPRTNLRDPDMQWDFWSLCPESLHQVTWLFGDRGLPKTYRHMNGYSSHTYSLINREGERVWVKFHFKTQQGHRTPHQR